MNNITTTKRDDGMVVASDEMHEIETVSLVVQVKTGSRNEQIQNNGVSHFLEHMAFKGTNTRSALQIAEDFDAIGGYFNAYTSREKTVYYAKVLKDDVELASDIISDILQNSLFAEDEIKKECSVILQEIAQTNDTPDDIIFDHFQSVAYPDQAFGRSILGKVDNVSSVTQAQLKQYVADNYYNENIIITAAGKINHSELLGVVDKKFGGFYKSGAKHEEKAIYMGGDVRVNKDIEQVHIVLGLNGVSYDHDDYYAHQILSLIAGGGMSSRLFQEIRERRGLVYTVSSFSSHYSDNGIFGIYGATTPENANEFLHVAVDEMQKLMQNITKEEIERAKSQVKVNLLMSQESSIARAERLSGNIAAFGRYIAIPEALQKIYAIDKSDLARALESILYSKFKPTLASIGKIDKLIKYEDLIKKLNQG
ncbi:MAG: M16 family metallopeptidase [Alphaproteobacteria bacterium]|jgi:predicted Zn-dependent peptidase|nr:insulinase family protein [Candidatus Jidaibacter sp.]